MRAANAHQNNRVVGYAPVLISEKARADLHAFKETNMPVDLRIERSMVSAATQLVLEDTILKPDLLERTRGRLQEEIDSGMETTGMLPGFCPVLMRVGTKEQVRFLVSSEGIPGSHMQAERVLVTEAIELVLGRVDLHSRWVDLISKCVGWEVNNTFQRRVKTTA